MNKRTVLCKYIATSVLLSERSQHGKQVLQGQCNQNDQHNQPNFVCKFGSQYVFDMFPENKAVNFRNNNRTVRNAKEKDSYKNYQLYSYKQQHSKYLILTSSKTTLRNF